jgi:hypothetical protein
MVEMEKRALGRENFIRQEILYGKVLGGEEPA